MIRESWQLVTSRQTVYAAMYVLQVDLYQVGACPEDRSSSTSEDEHGFPQACGELIGTRFLPRLCMNSVWTMAPG